MVGVDCHSIIPTENWIYKFWKLIVSINRRVLQLLIKVMGSFNFQLLLSCCWGFFDVNITDFWDILLGSFFFPTYKFVPTLLSCLVCFVSRKADCFYGGSIKNWNMDKYVDFRCPQNSNCLKSIWKKNEFSHNQLDEGHYIWILMEAIYCRNPLYHTIKGELFCFKLRRS